MTDKNTSQSSEKQSTAQPNKHELVDGWNALSTQNYIIADDGSYPYVSGTCSLM